MAESRRTDEDFSPLYRQWRNTQDSAQWDAVVQQQAPRRTPAQLIDTIAPQHGVDPALMKAMMHLESDGKPDAESSPASRGRGTAKGLMQLMDGTAKRFGVTDPFDPEQNIRGSARYLAYLKDQFPGRVDLQVAAYHAGDGAVRHAGGIPQGGDGQIQTRDYVRTILARYQPGGQATPGTQPVPGATRFGYTLGTQLPPGSPLDGREQYINAVDRHAAVATLLQQFPGQKIYLITDNDGYPRKFAPASTPQAPRTKANGVRLARRCRRQ